MRQIVVLSLVLFLSRVHANDLNAETINKLERIESPRIIGNTLYINGAIGSHIYDFLSYEAEALKAVSQVELNSLGGNVEWGLEIAKKLRQLKVDTVLPEQNYCASACVYLFAAGQKRRAAQNTWLGIHGARLGAGFTTTFRGLCFTDETYTPNQTGCAEFRKHWFDLTLQSTDDAFSFMQSNGISETLRTDYFALPDDPEWPRDLNILRKPDWPLSSTEAKRYNLVTEVF